MKLRGLFATFAKSDSTPLEPDYPTKFYVLKRLGRSAKSTAFPSLVWHFARGNTIISRDRRV